MNPAAFVRFCSAAVKRFGGLIGEVKGMVRQQAKAAEPDAGVGVGRRIRDRDESPRQPSPAGRLLPASAAGAALCDERWGCARCRKPGARACADRLLLQEAERAEATVGEEGLVREPQLQAQRGKEGIFARRGQGISQPLPCVLFIRRNLIAFHDGERSFIVGPATKQFTAEHEVRTSVEDAQQVPEFMNFGLNRRRRAEQQVSACGDRSSA